VAPLLWFTYEARVALLAFKAVKHYVNDVCKPCVGRGFDIIPGTPVLSNQICPHCRRGW